ncbi:phage major capsid protein [Vibrio ishigakensis]|uniref:Phage major capsid protein n=1 Tax=Vibrio ishigakensis TaxID=1481914 RepID=A0A0B8PLS9_9VIBR|nr:phage major capsid protein [Vibrio ishigakensis]
MIRVTDWTPYEISIVAVPADITVGVGRDAELEIEKNGEREPPSASSKQEKNMSETNETEVVNVDEVTQAAINAERKRSADIRALGKKSGQVTEAEEAISNGVEFADFARSINIKKTKEAGASRNLNLDVSNDDIQKYSLRNMILAHATGDFSKVSREMEISNTLASASGVETRGFRIPVEVLTRTNNTTNAGALVPEEHRGDMFIQALRDASIVGQLGARFYPNLVGDVSIPRNTGDVVGEWVAEGGTPTDENMTFDNVTLTPRTLTAAVPMTRKLQLQSSPTIEGIVQDSILYAMARALDVAMLKGEGPGSDQPTGILNATDVSEVMRNVDNKVDWGVVVDMETAINTANAQALA